MDPYYGMPQWVGSTLAFLTDAAPGLDARAVVHNFLASQPNLLATDPAELANARMPRDFLTDHNGVHHLTFQQQIKGVDLFECTVQRPASRVPDGRLINIGSTMLPRLQGDFVVAPGRASTDLDAIRIAAEQRRGQVHPDHHSQAPMPRAPSQKRTVEQHDRLPR